MAQVRWQQTMNKALYDGYEVLVQGIFIPVCISVAASLVRVALYGWHGARDYCASLCAGCFASVCAGWLLALCDLPMPVNAVVIGLAGITGKDTLAFLLSRKTLACIGQAARKRLSYEILNRWRPPRAGDMNER